MTVTEALQRSENTLLLGTVVCYLASMLLLWVHVFFRPDDSTHVTQLQHRKAAWWGHNILAMGALLHLLSLIGQGSPLFSVRVGVAGLFGWVLAVAYLAFGRRAGRDTLGAFVSPVVLLAALYSLTAPSLHRLTRVEQLETQWLMVHVILILCSYVSLALAFSTSLLYSLQEGLLKRKKLAGLWQRLPSLQVADALIYRTTSFGLAMLTLGILTGIAWMQRHQAGYSIASDPKVLFTLATWFTFAMYLAARWWLGWRGRRVNMVVIYGFVLLVVSFLGAPHVLNSATR